MHTEALWLNVWTLISNLVYPIHVFMILNKVTFLCLSIPISKTGLRGCLSRETVERISELM